MSRERRWSPPARRAGEGPISPALRPETDGNRHAYSSNPNDHIALYRPGCGHPGCHEPGMIWSRCRCRRAFARCHLHESTNPMAAARAAHHCPTGAP